MTESATTYGYSSIERKMKSAFYNVDQKLLWIPIVFLLIRMWGNLRFFISLAPSCHYTCDHRVVVLPDCYSVLYHPILVYLQSIGDPGQGWSNALLFVVFHKPIADRLFPWWFVCWPRVLNCFRRCAGFYLVCRVQRKRVVDDSPPSSMAHCTPPSSKSSTYAYDDHDPLIIKKKSGSKTSYDNASVLYYSNEHDGSKPQVVVANDNTSINEFMGTID